MLAHIELEEIPFQLGRGVDGKWQSADGKAL